jgi:hypothetical protein
MTPTVRAPDQRRRHRDQRAAHRAGLVEVAGELQLGIEVVGADHRHRPQRSPSYPSAAIPGLGRGHQWL